MNWNEKYRPNNLDEVKGHAHDIAIMKAIVKEIHEGVDDSACPNIYIDGPPGTGKTATIRAFLKTAFGPDYKTNYKEFNASETKVDKIRNDVMDLAKKPPLGSYTAPDGNVYDIPFNLIFLDEVDALSPKSQAILRRVMEEHAHITKFVLSCNFGHKVIDALKSRCAIFHFGRLSPDDIAEVLNRVIKGENIDIDPEALDLLCKSSKGDARKAQNILYKAHLLGPITENEIKQCSGILLENFNTRILQIAITSKNKDDKDYSKDFKMLENNIDKLYYDQGFSATQIVMNIFDSVIDDEKMPIGLKRKLFESIGECLRDCSLVESDLYALKMWLRGLK